MNDDQRLLFLDAYSELIDNLDALPDAFENDPRACRALLHHAKVRLGTIERVVGELYGPPEP